MPAADYATIAKQIISLYNAQAVTTAYPTGPTDLGTSKRNPGEIKEAVIEADIEARTAICQTLGNGLRQGFITPTVLTPLSGNSQSAKLPERFGPVSKVEIQIASGDQEWIDGEQAPLNEIREMIRNPGGVFGVAHNASHSSTGGYYFIDEATDFIEWTGNAVRAYAASIGIIDRATPTLLTPDAYSPYLVARGISLLFKHGDIPAFIQYYDLQAARMMVMIREGKTVLPNLEPVLRAA
jgi:hypothetical protein